MEMCRPGSLGSAQIGRPGASCLRALPSEKLPAHRTWGSLLVPPATTDWSASYPSRLTQLLLEEGAFLLHFSQSLFLRFSRRIAEHIEAIGLLHADSSLLDQASQLPSHVLTYQLWSKVPNLLIAALLCPTPGSRFLSPMLHFEVQVVLATQ